MIRRFLPLILFCALAFFFGFMSQLRLVAGDEGFYVMAAKLVSSGKEVYSDFFYPQMPLVPRVYGWWMNIIGPSWESARVFSAILSTVLGVLLYHRLKELFGWTIATIGVLLFASSTLAFAWFTTVKTFSLSALFLFGSYYLLVSRVGLQGWTKLFVAGCLFGLSVNTRLFFIGLFPILAVYVYFYGDALVKRSTGLMFFCLGTFLSLSPSLLIILRDFDLFYFNNLGYHFIRSNRLPERAWEAKLTILKTMLGLRDTKQFSGGQFPIFFWVTTIGLLLHLATKRKVDLAVWIALGLFVLNLVPTPSYVQYFSVLVPFLIIGFFLAIKYGEELYSPPRAGGLKNRLPFILSCTLTVVFVWNHGTASLKDLEAYTKTGEGVIGVGTADAPHKTLAALAKISESINRHTTPSVTIMAEWPGYLVNTHADPYPGLENQFGWAVGHKVDTESRRKYKIISRSEVADLLRAGESRYAILEKKSYDRNYTAAMNNYNLLSELPGALLFERKQ